MCAGKEHEPLHLVCLFCFWLLGKWEGSISQWCLSLNNVILKVQTCVIVMVCLHKHKCCLWWYWNSPVIFSFVKIRFSVIKVKCWKQKVIFPSSYLPVATWEHSSLNYEINIKKKLWCFNTVKFPPSGSVRALIFGTSPTVFSALQVTQAGTAWKLKVHCWF